MKTTLKFPCSSSFPSDLFFLPLLKKSSLGPSVLCHFPHLFPNSLTNFSWWNLFFLGKNEDRREGYSDEVQHREAQPPFCGWGSHCQRVKGNSSAAHCGGRLCFVLYFLLSSKASKVLRTPLMWGFIYPALLCVLLEPLGYKEAAENEGTQESGLTGP